MTEQRLLSWSIDRNTSPATVYLTGVIHEGAHFVDLIAEISEPVVFDFHAIKRINSYGVYQWTQFLQKVEAVGPHQLARCPMPMVDVLNRVPAARGQARVISVMAPHLCPLCEHEQEVMVETDQGKWVLPTIACDECGATMAFDHIEDQFFSFLER